MQLYEDDLDFPLSHEIYDIEYIKDKVAKALSDKPVYEVILFGSYAKGDPDEISDIDLMIDTHHELRGMSLISITTILEKTLNKRIDCFDIAEIDIPSPFYDEIINTGIKIYEKK